MTESDAPLTLEADADAGADWPADRAAAPHDARRNWGYLLLGVGALLLFERIAPRVVEPLWAIVMLAAGAAFVRMWRREPDTWWPLIPGLALLALGLGRLLDAVGLGRASGELIGPLLFLGLGTAFVVVYLRDRSHWWAVIPAGAMLGLAGTTLFGAFGAEGWSGASLFVGLGAAFLWLLAVERQSWAIFPAGAMVALALVILGDAAGVDVPDGVMNAGSYVWPVLLMGLGAWLLVRREQAQ